MNARTPGARESPQLMPARVIGLQLTDDERVEIRQKLRTQLGPFAESIVRASARVAGVDGPCGGADFACRVRVVLRGRPDVVVERRHTLARFAADEAVNAAQQAVARAIARRREPPRDDEGRPSTPYGLDASVQA